MDPFLKTQNRCFWINPFQPIYNFKNSNRASLLVRLIPIILLLVLITNGYGQADSNVMNVGSFSSSLNVAFLADAAPVGYEFAIRLEGKVAGSTTYTLNNPSYNAYSVYYTKTIVTTTKNGFGDISYTFVTEERTDPATTISIKVKAETVDIYEAKQTASASIPLIFKMGFSDTVNMTYTCDNSSYVIKDMPCGDLLVKGRHKIKGKKSKGDEDGLDDFINKQLEWGSKGDYHGKKDQVIKDAGKAAERHLTLGYLKRLPLIKKKIPAKIYVPGWPRDMAFKNPNDKNPPKPWSYFPNAIGMPPIVDLNGNPIYPGYNSLK